MSSLTTPEIKKKPNGIRSGERREILSIVIQTSHLKINEPVD